MAEAQGEVRGEVKVCGQLRLLWAPHFGGEPPPERTDLQLPAQLLALAEDAACARAARGTATPEREEHIRRENVVGETRRGCHVDVGEPALCEVLRVERREWEEAHISLHPVLLDHRIHLTLQCLPLLDEGLGLLRDVLALLRRSALDETRSPLVARSHRLRFRLLFRDGVGVDERRVALLHRNAFERLRANANDGELELGDVLHKHVALVLDQPHSPHFERCERQNDRAVREEHDHHSEEHNVNRFKHLAHLTVEGTRAIHSKHHDTDEAEQCKLAE